MIHGAWLLVRKEWLFEDSWTYGDWRQKIAFLGDEAVCVRHSKAPFLLWTVGALLLWSMAFVLAFLIPLAEVNIVHTVLFGAAGLALVLPYLVQRIGPWQLVVMVGEVMRKRDDGSFRRSPWGDME